MATQEEVRNFVIDRYNPRESEDGTLIATFVDAGRSQQTFINVYDSSIEVQSAFARTSDITDAQAFEISKDSALGIGKVPGFYVVKNVMPIKDLDTSEIILAIEMPTVFADDFEKALGLGDDL